MEKIKKAIRDEFVGGPIIVISFLSIAKYLFYIILFCIVSIFPLENLNTQLYLAVIRLQPNFVWIGSILTIIIYSIVFLLSGYLLPKYSGLWGVLPAPVLALFSNGLSETLIMPLYKYGPIPHGSESQQLLRTVIVVGSTFIVSPIMCFVGAKLGVKSKYFRSSGEKIDG